MFLSAVLLIFLFGFFLYLAVATYAAVTMTKVGDHPQYSDDPGTFGLDYISVRFHPRKDKLNLAGWFIPNSTAERVIVLVHGRNASKQNAISGKLPKLAVELHQAGFAVLMIDLRGHGESEGKRYTFGVYEKRDVLGAVDYLLEKGYAPGKIGVLGISLGAAAAIGAAAEEPAIGALIVDSAFSDLNALVEPKWEAESGLPKFMLPGVYFMWQILFGFDLGDVKPVDWIVKVAPRPILILHCKADQTADISHAAHLAEAVPHAHLVAFNGCEHAEIYRDRPHEYLEALLPFLNQHWQL